MKILGRPLLVLSVFAFASCGSGPPAKTYDSSTKRSEHMQFVSAGPYVGGKTVKFVCVVQPLEHKLKPGGPYIAKAVFTSVQDEYVPKVVSKEFTMPTKALQLEVSGFSRLAVGGRHFVEVSIVHANRPNKVLSTLRQAFLATKITPSMTKQYGLKTVIVGPEGSAQAVPLVKPAPVKKSVPKKKPVVKKKPAVQVEPAPEKKPASSKPKYGIF